MAWDGMAWHVMAWARHGPRMAHHVHAKLSNAMRCRAPDACVMQDGSHFTHIAAPARAAVLFHNLHMLAGAPGEVPSIRDGHLFSAYLMMPLAATTLGLLAFNWYPSQVR